MKVGTDPDAPLLDAIFRYAPIGLGFWDIELRCRRINPALAEINGVPVEETIGRTMPEVIGQLGEELETLFRGVLESGEPLVNTTVVGETPARPGVARRWRATYYPVRDEAGAPAGVAAAVVEVTGQHEAEQRERSALLEARAATALLDALVDAAPVGIGFLDRDLRYQRVNRALAEINGVRVDEMLGRTPSEILGALGAEIEEHMRRVRDTGQPALETEVAGRLPTRGSAIQHREGNWFPVFDADGRVVGVGGVTRDVTERHRIDRERQRLLKDAVTARAHAEAAQVRAESAKAAAEEARREAELARSRTEFLAEAGRRLAVSMEYESTLQEVAQIVARGLADWCIVAVRRPDGGVASIAVAHRDPALEELARSVAERYPPRLDAARGIGKVIRTGEPELVETLTDDVLQAAAQSPEHLEMLRRIGMRSVLIVPLRTPGRPVGAIALVRSERSPAFTDDDVVLASTLADRAALHIRNAQLYTERSHIARTLQASLLPRGLPRIPGIELAARYLAAGDQNEVGGDFYDAFPSGPGVWTALIGDVAGKGPEAAALTSLTRHTLRTAAMFDDDPVENLRVLNRALLTELQGARFCTVLYVRIVALAGAEGAVLRLATGGHPPPRIVRADGAVETVALNGTLIGWEPEPHLGLAEVRLRPGDLLLMFTDGVIETRGNRPDAGERGLTEELRGLAGAPAEEVVETVLRRAVALHGPQPPDDIALLAVRATPA